MNCSIITSSYFDVAAKKLAKKYTSFKEDLVNFGKSLLENPKQGTELAPGIRKIRMAIKAKGKGKSGGARVITYSFITQEMDGKIVLLLIYDKEDASTAKYPFTCGICEKKEKRGIGFYTRCEEFFLCEDCIKKYQINQNIANQPIIYSTPMGGAAIYRMKNRRK